MASAFAVDEQTHIAQVIFEHAARIAKAPHVPALIRLNADLARDLTGADRCSLWLIDDKKEQLFTRVAHGVDEIRIACGAGLVGSCVNSGEIVLLNDAANSPLLLRSVDHSTGYRTESVLCVPVKVDGEIIGALQVLNKQGGFLDKDVELLQLVALYAGSAIQSERLRKDAETARLLRHELDIAKSVQQRLLPQDAIPVAGLDHFAFCRAARSVGGDYYDLAELPDGRFAFTLGDVSGKGIPAALLMASIHTLLRSLLAHNPANPAQVFNALNGSLCRNASSERYSTLFCGVIDSRRETLTYVNAGHVRPLIVRRDGGILEPSEGDLPIGMLPSATYSQHDVPLRSGDTILVMSDGILDLDIADTVEWGTEQICSLMAEYRHDTSKVLVSALTDAVDRMTRNSEQFDDMSAIAIHVLP